MLAIGASGHLHIGTARPAAVTANPFTPNSASIVQGWQTFVANCRVCHARRAGGTGQRPQGAPPRLPILVVHLPPHGDGSIFQFVRNGIGGTAMRPFD